MWEKIKTTLFLIPGIAFFCKLFIRRNHYVQPKTQRSPQDEIKTYIEKTNKDMEDFRAIIGRLPK